MNLSIVSSTVVFFVTLGIRRVQTSETSETLIPSAIHTGDPLLFHKLKLLHIETVAKDGESSYKERSSLFKELSFYEEIEELQKRIHYIKGLFDRYGNYSEERYNNLQDSFNHFTICASEPCSFPPCNYELALCYEKGYGCEIDLQKAAQFYERNPDDQKSIFGLLRIKGIVASLRDSLKTEAMKNLALESEIVSSSLIPTPATIPNIFFSHARSALTECQNDHEINLLKKAMFSINYDVPVGESLFKGMLIEAITNNDPTKIAFILFSNPTYPIDKDVIVLSIRKGCSLEILTVLLKRYDLITKHSEEEEEQILEAAIERGDLSILERLLEGDATGRGAISFSTSILKKAVYEFRIPMIRKLLSDATFSDVAVLKKLIADLTSFEEYAAATATISADHHHHPDYLVHPTIAMLSAKVNQIERRVILSREKLDISDLIGQFKTIKALLVVSYLIHSIPSIKMKDNIILHLSEEDREKVAEVFVDTLLSQGDALKAKIQSSTGDNILERVNEIVKDGAAIDVCLDNCDIKALHYYIALLTTEDIAKMVEK